MKQYEYILCAAIKRLQPREVEPYYKGLNDICDIEIGYRHHDIMQRFTNEISHMQMDQGFYTSYGRYVDRWEGMKIAFESGQVTGEVALSKKWHEIHEGIFNEPPNDKNKFNMLFSEDLY